MRNPIKMRRLGSLAVVAAAAVVCATLGVRQAVAAVYTVPFGSMEPELPRGSRILVYKLADTFTPGDIVAYRHSSGRTYLGRFEGEDGAGVLAVSRNGTGPLRVQPGDVIGRVVLSTR